MHAAVRARRCRERRAWSRGVCLADSDSAPLGIEAAELVEAEGGGLAARAKPPGPRRRPPPAPPARG
eukprot:gene11743-17261_t